MRRFFCAIALVIITSPAAFANVGNAASVKAYAVESVGDRLWAALETDNSVTVAFSDNGGAKWTELDIDAPQGMRAASPRLGLSADGTLMLFYTLTRSYYDGDGTLVMRRCENAQAADPSWSGETALGHGFASGRPCIQDGSLILPTDFWGREQIGSKENVFGNAGWPYIQDNGKYHDLDSLRGPGVFISSDGGSTWLANYRVCDVPSMIPASYDNPQIVSGASGRLNMYCRSNGTGWCYSSASMDSGHHWTEPQKFISNPYADISFMRLKSGRLLMLRTIRFDNFLWWEREGVFAYLSEDDGSTWYGGLRLDDSSEALSPCAAQKDDGTIAVLWNRDGVVRMGFTSEDEIDRSTADPLSMCKNISSAFIAGRADKAAKDADRPLLASRKKWSKEPIKIGTYNIQYRNNIWESHRLHAVVSLLEQYDFDVFGAQEPFITQIEDMMEATGGKWAWVGACIDGKNESKTAHYDPIFYKPDKFDLENWGIVWFTPKPGESGYGAWSSRHLCWARLRQKSSGLSFYCFNSHFDHIGAEAKRMAARILVEAVRDIAGGMPAFLTGDFNSNEKTVPYAIITSEKWLYDSIEAVPDPENAEYFSMSNYKPMSTVAKSHLHIDHIFFTPNSSRVLSWKLITDSYDGDFGSDHLPIIVKWKIAN